MHTVILRRSCWHLINLNESIALTLVSLNFVVQGFFIIMLTPEENENMQLRSEQRSKVTVRVNKM